MVSIYWTAQAREDLREIRAFISRDAPKTAHAFVRRLRAATGRLRDFPESGQVVPELGRDTDSATIELTSWRSFTAQEFSATTCFDEDNG